jgi:O-acetylhomoserine (thiol)-lyase
MADHVKNAQAVAEYLESDSRIEWVKYSGLASHPHNARAKKYLPLGPGAVFSFGVKGSDSVTGREAGEKFINSVKLASHLANIGDVRTLVIHPASTTHRQLTDEQLVEAGVPQDLIRISVGIEDLDDIIWDLDQALTTATGRGR